MISSPLHPKIIISEKKEEKKRGKKEEKLDGKTF